MTPFLSCWNPRRWYAELRHVWQDTWLLVLSAQIAAIYAALLIPFKVGIPIIPGFVELRPANVISIVSSLLFGPAAAWGRSKERRMVKAVAGMAVPPLSIISKITLVQIPRRVEIDRLARCWFVWFVCCFGLLPYITFSCSPYLFLMEYLLILVSLFLGIMNRRITLVVGLFFFCQLFLALLWDGR